MKPSSSLKILYPTAFHFKEERVLAAHPPNCHPQGCLSSEKVRESGGKRKEAGELKVSRQKETFINGEKRCWLQCLLGLIYCPKIIQIIKINKSS